MYSNFQNNQSDILMHVIIVVYIVNVLIFNDSLNLRKLSPIPFPNVRNEYWIKDPNV